MSMHFFLSEMEDATSSNNSLHPQGPFEPVHGLTPQPPVAALAREGGIGRNLPLAPDAHDASMNQVDATLAVQTIETFHHIVRLAGPERSALVCGVTRTFTACHQRSHGPEPGLLGVTKRLRPAAQTRARST